MSTKHFLVGQSALLLSVFLFGCGATGEDIGTAEQASHSWGGYHWARTSNPFTLKLGDNVNSTWDPILATTSSDWNKSTVLDTTIVAGSANTKTCRATSGMVQVCNNTYGNNGWLGIAGISLSGGHISQGYVKLNDSYFNTPTYNTTAWRNLVSCQEVGHTFGLDHQDEDFDNANLGTCMDYTSDPASNQHPNAHDYDQLQTIYGHNDSSTTVGAAAPTSHAAVLAGESPAEWGTLVDSKGPMATYYRELGEDHGVITHVFWAPF
jgi:hypothetical protein